MSISRKIRFYVVFLVFSSFSGYAGAEIYMDNPWQTAHGSPPYILDEDDTTYILQEDIVSEETGIVIAGKNMPGLMA